MRPPALCAPSFPKRLEEEKFLVFFFFFLRVALHHRVRGRFAKKRIQWLHYSCTTTLRMACALRKRATGGKSLFIIGSLKVQEPTTQKKTHNNDDDARQKSPLFFFLSERSSVSSFSRRRLDFYHVDTTTRKKRNRDVCKKYIKKRTPTRSYYYGGVFSWCAPKLSLSSKR